ncbi:MAG TPA: DUF2975 domain-containing protein [Sphingomicrobium sp.]|nr:DUF2975 domain-containing protein [Sphingomicrobium sp.]
MPAESKPDRLLFATRLVLTFLIWFTAAAAVLCTLLIPIVILKHGAVARDLVENDIRAEALPWMVLLLVLGIALAILGFFFFRLLRRIVDSVSEGDPFIPVNADRLYHMAWLSLGIQAVLIAATPLMFWFDALPEKPNVHRGDSGLSLGALVTALLLFVLARVFRVGSQMREELEGTV